MKLRIYIYVSDGQDGSVYVHPANSFEEAEAAVEAELNNCGQAFKDGGASYIDIEVNSDGTYTCPPLDIEVDEE